MTVFDRLHYPPERIRYVGMGGMFVGRAERLIIQASNLGSCIGIVLYDTMMRVGCMAHIVLPHAGERTQNLMKYADTALPLLFEQFSALGGGSGHIICKIAGGAKMFSDEMHIGAQNITTVLEILAQYRIPVQASALGGDISRTMNLYLKSGLVTIRVAGESRERLL